MWPACSAPMVRTRPIERPSRRNSRDASRISPACSITAGASAPVLDLFSDCVHVLGGRSRPISGVLVLRSWELSGAHLLRIPGGCLRDLFGQIGVALDELRRLAGGQAE